MTSASDPASPNTLDGLEELMALCADRPPGTRELFSGNAFYGNATILRDYAGLNTTYPLSAVIPHGTYLDPSFVWGAEIDAKVVGVMSFPEYRDNVYRATTSKVVIPSASPYVYLLRQMQPTASADREGTLFFPSHSTHHYVSPMEPEHLARALLEVDAAFQPVVVCMYWKDIQLGRHQPFERSGLKVVTAGHMYDPDFLLRLHGLCSRFRYSSGQSIGSHVFYSVGSGCTHVRLIEGTLQNGSIYGWRTAETYGLRARGVPPPGVFDLLDEAFLRSRWDRELQQQAADYFLGAANALSPSDLRGLIEELRVLDRRGYTLADGRRRYVPPGWLRRRLPVRALTAAGRRLRTLSRSSMAN